MSIPDAEQTLHVRELVTIRKFRDLPEALLAKGSLDSSGIESFLADENMVHMDWLISNMLGGVKLQVDAVDVEIANEILNHFTVHPDDTIDGMDEGDEISECRILPFKKPLKFS